MSEIHEIYDHNEKRVVGRFRHLSRARLQTKEKQPTQNPNWAWKFTIASKGGWKRSTVKLKNQPSLKGILAKWPFPTKSM